MHKCTLHRNLHHVEQWGVKFGGQDHSLLVSNSLSAGRLCLHLTSFLSPYNPVHFPPDIKWLIDFRARLEKSRAQRVLWLLEELKVPYDLKTFKRTKDRLAPPELREVHPLGKSPIVSIEGPTLSKPLVIAETGAIIEHLTKYFGKWLIPKEFKEGREDELGGQSEEWMRYRFYMHYAEGSLMPLLLTSLLVGGNV